MGHLMFLKPHLCSAGPAALHDLSSVIPPVSFAYLQRHLQKSHPEKARTYPENMPLPWLFEKLALDLRHPAWGSQPTGSAKRDFGERG